MAGTKLGGKKAAATNKARYGKDFYRIIGGCGGRNGHTGGFADRALASWAGHRGGVNSVKGMRLIGTSYVINKHWPNKYLYYITTDGKILRRCEDTDRPPRLYETLAVGTNDIKKYLTDNSNDMTLNGFGNKLCDNNYKLLRSGML